jgi:hypothetical protein
MDRAIQHAPQPIRQFMDLKLLYVILCFSRKAYTQALDVLAVSFIVSVTIFTHYKTILPRLGLNFRNVV